MELSKNFTLEEMCESQRAKEHGIVNQVTDTEHLNNLKALCTKVLQPLRDEWGSPIRVTSGYRRPQLNTLLKGASTSQHLVGSACDLDVGEKSDNLRLFELAANSDLPFDQLINEFDGEWVHISHKNGGVQRGQILESKRGKNGKTYYTDITKKYR